MMRCEPIPRRHVLQNEDWRRLHSGRVQGEADRLCQQEEGWPSTPRAGPDSSLGSANADTVNTTPLVAAALVSAQTPLTVAGVREMGTAAARASRSPRCPSPPALSAFIYEI